MASPLLWTQQVSEDALCISAKLAVYPLEVIFRVCYQFTDRCYLFLAPEEEGALIKVQITQKSKDCDLMVLAGEFCNELINQRVRADIAKETKAIRELIVAQAFAEADFLESETSASYLEDPKGIAK